MEDPNGENQAAPAWVAFLDDGVGSVEDEWRPFREGSVVRLMSEEGVDCPLWEVGVGLMFSDISEFVAAGGPPDVAADLVQWASDADSCGESAELDRRAVDLVRRLSAAFEHAVHFVYQP